MREVLTQARSYVTFFTALIAIGAITLVGVAVAGGPLSDHDKYGTVAFGSSAVLELPSGKVAVAYGTFVEDTHFDHILVPQDIGVQIVPVDSATSRPTIERDPADFYSEQLGTTVNQAQRVWTARVQQSGAYRVTPEGNGGAGELLLGHDAAVDTDTIIVIGVIAAVIDAAAWLLTSQLRRRSRRRRHV